MSCVFFCQNWLFSIQRLSIKPFTLVSISNGGFLVVSGVSGSGKSTLVNEILLKALYQKLGLKTDPPGKHKSIDTKFHFE